ncbi:hypothetical protein E3E12_04730 [Formicincola oecophyllae]|uniref:Uncharacterized protein n=1 Tax=Formicincola oecophyllae TaxID=2558361 RepID=A0A4Y6U8C0_9PROT|nr:hypothetical protein [Formicincola oecophyllae]QDH13612.1 hypothetical protein E3E12_04730 [Formicincola oecophyllae]
MATMNCPFPFQSTGRPTMQDSSLLQQACRPALVLLGVGGLVVLGGCSGMQALSNMAKPSLPKADLVVPYPATHFQMNGMTVPALKTPGPAGLNRPIGDAVPQQGPRAPTGLENGASTGPAMRVNGEDVAPPTPEAQVSYGPHGGVRSTPESP